MTMKRWTRLLPALCLAAGLDAAGAASKTADEGVGALLYSTHCVGCHTAQVHWRAGKRATNAAALRAEVRRWQDRIGLGWSDDEIAAVTQYLNTLHYHFPDPGRVASRTRGPT